MSSDIGRIEAGIDAMQRSDRSQQEPGGRDQRDRQRDFGGNEHRTTCARASAGRRRPPAFRPERSLQVRASSVEKRQEAERHRNRDRHANDDEQHAQIDAHLGQSRRACRRQRQHRADGGEGQPDAGSGRHGREDRALDDELPRKLPHARAQG
jgi:hypothetical protein